VVAKENWLPIRPSNQSWPFIVLSELLTVYPSNIFS